MEFEHHLNAAKERRRARQKADNLQAAPAQHVREQSRQKRRLLEEASRSVWSVVDKVLGELKEKGVQSDTRLIDETTANEYLVKSAPYGFQVKPMQKLRNARHKHFVASNSIAGWDLHAAMGESGSNNKQNLYLGEDGHIYALYSMSDKESEWEVIIPDTFMKHDETFSKTEYCEQVLDALAELTMQHQLNPPGGWTEDLSPR